MKLQGRIAELDTISVLLIEDNLVDALMMTHLLEQPNKPAYKVTQVSDLAEAIAQVGTHRYDCILLDLMLPDSSGLQSVQRLEQAASSVPIIVLTGIKNVEMALAAIDKGAQDYLVKNEVDRNVLTRTIRYSIERQRMVMELKQAYQIEQYLSTHDSLTGLPSRQLFFDRLTQSMSYANRYDSCVALLFIDLNRFKKINDTLGHQAGDHLLQATAKRLSSCVRKSDTVARYGGDEFVVLLVNINRLEDVDSVAQKIISRMAQPFRTQTHEFYVSLSIGIALFPNDADTADTLLRHADQAMYQAKKFGGNMFVYYDTQMELEAKGDLGTENTLLQALKRNEFFLQYQPQYDVSKNRVIGVEALIRWNHPKQGLVLPSNFISCAEQTGLILPIGQWVLQSVCSQEKSWEKEGAPTRIAINLSARQFRQADLVSMIKLEMQKAQITGDHIEIEVTESNLMQNLDSSVEILKALKDLGVRVTIDDFGTGYSSLYYLKKLPLDALKIDQSFIHDIHKDPADVAILRSILSLADSLKLEAIAEGVETKDQMDALTSLGCRYMQGRYFSPPLVSDDISKLMAN